jgi:hypothetical protein
MLSYMFNAKVCPKPEQQEAFERQQVWMLWQDPELT